MNRVQSTVAVEALFREPLAIIFKHSTQCPVSSAAYREVESFLTAHPDAPVHLLLVIEDRRVSNFFAERCQVRHESPQLIMLKEGRVVWHDSHYGITQRAIEGHLPKT
jgi:bacillithiol system protein YtxJ